MVSKGMTFLHRTLLALALVSPHAAHAVDTPWAHVARPSAGPTHAIGSYAKGCIAGAVALPLAGTGYEVIRPERNRFYGHPDLIDLISKLGAAVDAAAMGKLRVGDLGQPRGGPAPSGHASHQIGLDADLGFALGPRAAGVFQETMVDGKAQKPLPAFGDAQVKLLRLAAEDPRVDRIFINPVLKRALCELPGEPADRAWRKKTRAWWGHDEHLHVRLHCPSDSPHCQNQAPLDDDEACKKLDWWFRKPAAADRKVASDAYGKKVGLAPKLPDECAALIPPEKAGDKATADPPRDVAGLATEKPRRHPKKRHGAHAEAARP